MKGRLRRVRNAPVPQHAFKPFTNPARDMRENSLRSLIKRTTKPDSSYFPLSKRRLIGLGNPPGQAVLGVDALYLFRHDLRVDSVRVISFLDVLVYLATTSSSALARQNARILLSRDSTTVSRDNSTVIAMTPLHTIGLLLHR